MHRLSFLKDFLYLLYPEVCLVCPNNLVSSEQFICTACKYDLPKTNFPFGETNPIEQIFWGRTPIKAATSLYWFEKGGAIQHLLHELKYKKNKQVGIYMGELLGTFLSPFMAKMDIPLVCPVPLNVKKLKLRGYNQSELIARGFCKITDMPLHTNLLKRTRHTETQTSKSKIDRWENVQNVFEVTDKRKVSGKHILLIDDVITTGATLEACAQTLLNSNAASVSVATVAYAV